MSHFRMLERKMHDKSATWKKLPGFSYVTDSAHIFIQQASTPVSPLGMSMIYSPFEVLSSFSIKGLVVQNPFKNSLEEDAAFICSKNYKFFLSGLSKILTCLTIFVVVDVIV